jgi:hypothetical protein
MTNESSHYCLRHFLAALAFVATLISLNACSKTTGVQQVAPPKLVGCRAASWQPEVFSFYGLPADVLSNAKKADLDLYKHRVFLLVAEPVAESTKNAQVVLFEVPKTPGNNNGNDPWTETAYSIGQDKAAALRSDLDKQLLSNKGQNCVGDIADAIFKNDLAGVAPTSTKTANTATDDAAFGDVTSELNNTYLRVTIYILC